MLNFPADGGNEHRHQRAQVIKEAIGQIGQSGYTQHRCLRHATRVPGHKNRCDRGRILGGSTQQPGFETLLTIHVTEHIGSQHDADELIASGDIQENAGAYGAGH